MSEICATANDNLTKTEGKIIDKAIKDGYKMAIRSAYFLGKKLLIHALKDNNLQLERQ